MNILTVDSLTKAYGERKVFDNASFFLQEGEKAGIIGINRNKGHKLSSRTVVSGAFYFGSFSYK